MIEAAEERPWLWVVYILTVALPVFLVILFCCSGKVWVVVSLFCFILIHSYHVKNNQDILPEVFLCSSSVMTEPHLMLTSETLFTIFSGHLLCPDGRRIVSPSVASLVYCSPSYLAAAFWKKEEKKKQLRYKTDPSGHRLAFPAGIPVSVHILRNSIFDFSLSIHFSVQYSPLSPKHHIQE